MDNRLRKVRKAIKFYEEILAKDQQLAKQNKEQYSQDVANYQKFLEEFIEESSDKFQMWCTACTNTFCDNEDNLLKRIKNIIKMKIVNYNLNRYNDLLFLARSYEEYLKIVAKRFEQFKYFC